MRISTRRRDELGDLVRLYNRVGEILQHERAQIRQRELLLQSALGQSPIAIVLVNPLDRVVYANQESRRLFVGGARLVGQRFGEILEGPQELYSFELVGDTPTALRRSPLACRMADREFRCSTVAAAWTKRR